MSGNSEERYTLSASRVVDVRGSDGSTNGASLGGLSATAVPWLDISPCGSDVTPDAAAAEVLWVTLIRTRADSPVISAAEDAVFRFYLPLARALARSHAPHDVDPEMADEAAELGLAKAVLSWRRPDAAAFPAFANAAIQGQIRQLAASGPRSDRTGINQRPEPE